MYVSRAESRKVSEYYLLVTDSMIILISENESEKTSLRCESHYQIGGWPGMGKDLLVIVDCDWK